MLLSRNGGILLNVGRHQGVIRRILGETGGVVSYRPVMTKTDPFKYFRTSREIIRLAVMMYVGIVKLQVNSPDGKRCTVHTGLA